MNRHVMLFFLAVFGLFAACHDEGQDTQDPPKEEDATAMPLQCYSTVSVAQLHDAGDAIIASSANNNYVSVLTHDEGRTITRLSAEIPREEGTIYRGYNGPFQITHDHFAFSIPSTNTVVTRGWIPGASETSWHARGETPLAFVDADGNVAFEAVTNTTVSLPTGEQSDAVWTHDNIRIAQKGIWFWASVNNGAFEVVGTEYAVDKALYTALTLDGTVVAHNAHAAIIEAEPAHDFYVARPGQQLQELRAGWSNRNTRAQVVTLWNDNAVIMALPQNPTQQRSLIIRPIDGGEDIVIPWDETINPYPTYAVGTDGTLWIAAQTDSTVTHEPPEARLYRLRSPEDHQLERIALDFESADVEEFRSLIARPDGSLLFLAHSNAHGDGIGNEFYGNTMFCKVGKDLPQKIERIQTFTLDHIAASPGAAWRFSRVGDSARAGNQAFTTPAGTTLSIQDGQVFVGPPDTPAVELDGTPNPPALLPLNPTSAMTFLDWNDIGFGLALKSVQTSSSGYGKVPTQKLNVNLLNPATNQRQDLGVGDHDFWRFQPSPLGDLITGDSKTSFLREWLGHAQYRVITELGGNLIAGKTHAYIFGRAFYTGPEKSGAFPLRGIDLPIDIIRTPLFDGRKDATDCVPGQTGSSHMTIEDVDISSAIVNDAGDLYMADIRHGRILKIPVDKCEPEIVGSGFIFSTHLQLTHDQDTEILLVNDGDVWGFVPNPNSVASPTYASDVPPEGWPKEHAYSLCTDGEPCINRLAFGGILKGTGTQCIPGQNFGASGKILFNRKEIAGTWSDNSVCFESEETHNQNGQIVLVREDGQRPRAVPYYAPVRVTSVDIPKPLTVHTPIVVHGDNLMSGYGLEVKGNATLLLQSATNTTLTFTAVSSGPFQLHILDDEVHNSLSGKPANLTPTVLQGCASGPDQACSLTVSGMPFSPKTSEIFLTIDNDPTHVPVTMTNTMTLQWYWPSHVAPGEHTVHITIPNMYDTVQFDAQATRRQANIDTISANIDDPNDFSRSFPPPASTPLGIWTGLWRPRPGGFIKERVAWLGRVDDNKLGDSFLEYLDGAANLMVVSDGDRVFALGDYYGLHMYEITASTQPDRLFDANMLVFTDPMPTHGIRGAGFINDFLILVSQDNITAVDMATHDTQTLPGLDIQALTYKTNSARQSHGAWVGSTGVYAGSCYIDSPTAGARLLYQPLTYENGVFSLDEAVVTLMDDDTVTLVACHLTDNGFAWVERAANGTETLKAWDAATSTLHTIATIPAHIANSGNPASEDDTDLSSVMDILWYNDSWLLFVSSKEYGTGAFIAQYNPDSGAWTSYEHFGRALGMYPGQVCAGPVNNCVGHGFAVGECAVYACSIAPPGQHDADHVGVHHGRLLEHEGKVHAVYLIENLDRVPPLRQQFEGAKPTGIEIQHMTLSGGVYAP